MHHLARWKQNGVVLRHDLLEIGGILQSSRNANHPRVSDVEREYGALAQRQSIAYVIEARGAHGVVGERQVRDVLVDAQALCKLLGAGWPDLILF